MNFRINDEGTVEPINQIKLLKKIIQILKKSD